MAQKKGKGTPLKVFSGREAKLNLIIFLILFPDKLMTSYDIFLAVRKNPGFRHCKRQNVDRRLKALHHQGWLKTQGTKTAKAHFQSPLYKLSIRAEAALELAKKELDTFLLKAPEDQIEQFVKSLRMYP